MVHLRVSRDYYKVILIYLNTYNSLLQMNTFKIKLKKKKSTVKYIFLKCVSVTKQTTK